MHIELTFHCEAYDVYLETVRDLLPNTIERARKKRKAPLCGKAVSSLKELCVAYDSAQGRRLPARLQNGQIKAGSPNPRTHFAFIISITQRDAVTGETATTRLTLLDLAGSEADKGRGGPDAMKAYRQANKGLSAMGDVLSAIASRQSHIPYRNSKLTTLIRAGLPRDSVCILIASVNPEEVHHSETMNTLSFASHIVEAAGPE